MSKTKKKQEAEHSQFPSYRWFTLVRTPVGYQIMSVETNGQEIDAESLKVSDPDILAIQLEKLKHAMMRSAQEEKNEKIN